MRRLASLLALVFLALLTACPPEPEPEPEPETPEPAYEGIDPSLAVPEGEARAGRVQPDGEAALFGGIAAEGKVGDWMIHNEHVRYVIQDLGQGHGYIDTAGNIVDLDLVQPEGVLGRDPIDDLFLSFGVGWMFDAERIEVFADGADGEPAVLRATGGWKLWEFIHGTVESTEPLLPSTEFDITVDYELAPGSWSLKMTSTLTNIGAETTSVNPAVGYLASDEDWAPWVAGQGNAPEDLDDVRAMGGAGRNGESTFTIWPEEGVLRSIGLSELQSSAGISVSTYGWTDVAPGETLTMVRFVTVAPDSLTAEAERITTQGEVLGQVTGVVTDPDGEGVARARVHFVESGAEEPWIAGYAQTAEDGSYVAEVPPGDWDVYAVGRAELEHVDLPTGAGRVGPFAALPINDRVLAVIDGSATAEPLDLAAGWPTPAAQQLTVAAGTPAELDFVMEPRGTLVLDVVDDLGAPIPAYAEVYWTDGSAPPDTVPGALKEPMGIPASTSLFARVWTADGHVELPILPGTYQVRVEHSYRHARQTFTPVVVEPGGVTEVEATLAEVIFHDGWLSVDSHLHAAPSNDGHLAMEHRVIVCASTGVDLPVNTDHDRMADYRPIVTALGLDDRMQFIPGVEVSPVIRGHFNLFPVEPDPIGLSNGGAPPWWAFALAFGDDYIQQDLFDGMREAGGEHSMIQVNHGRSGMFSFTGYSPNTGTANEEENWSWDFDVFELINGTGRGNLTELRQDWFSFLSAGRNKIPVGVSDSHGRGSPCGYGRTDVFLDTDDPASVTPAQLRDAMLAGHVVVSGGVTLRVGSGDALPGDVVTGGSHVIDATVLGPDWMQPTVVRLYRNGELLEEVALPEAPDEDMVWFDDSFEVETATDSWFVVEVDGASGMGGVWRGGVPYAAAQAIFVDVAGDGWTAPGL
jgi:hypothetical protein